MKVVINTCFGGFGLSPKALLWMYERGAKGISMNAEEFYGVSKNKSKLKQLNDDLERFKEFQTTNSEKRDSLFITVFSPDEKFVLTCLDLKRDDPLLVECVETLGEESYGSCSKLSVVEIPDGINWEIDEYDGNETVDEVHRSWR